MRIPGLTAHTRGPYVGTEVGEDVFWGLGFRVYLNPRSMYNNILKPTLIAIKAIVVNTFGVQVGFSLPVSAQFAAKILPTNQPERRICSR